MEQEGPELLAPLTPTPFWSCWIFFFSAGAYCRSVEGVGSAGQALNGFQGGCSVVVCGEEHVCACMCARGGSQRAHVLVCLGTAGDPITLAWSSIACLENHLKSNSPSVTSVIPKEGILMGPPGGGLEAVTER